MIRVRVEVSDRAGSSFRAEVRAESMEQAVRLALESYPDFHARVLFPIEPETFFVGGNKDARAAIRAEAGRAERRGMRRHTSLQLEDGTDESDGLGSGQGHPALAAYGVGF